MNKTKKRKLLIIVILLILLLISSLYLLTFIRKTLRNVSKTQTEMKLPTDNIETKDDSYTELMGFGQLTITKNNPYINLINPKENDVYLSFDVFYKDELIYKSELIEPGMMEQVNIYEILDAGEHTLTYSIGSYNIKNKKAYWTGIQQNQDILINK